jgi:hypothetical protein
MYQPSEFEYQKPALFEPLPSPRKRLLGLQRNVLLQLYDADLIRIIEVHRPGRRRPIELVHVPSLIAYLERLEELAKNAHLAKIRRGYAKYHENAFTAQPDEKLPQHEPGGVDDVSHNSLDRSLRKPLSILPYRSKNL